jgi:hypothetical protein
MLARASVGCGVFFGDPIELFPKKHGIDGGVDSDSPCIEEAQRASSNFVTVIDATGGNLADLVQGAHTSVMTWPSNTTSNMTLTLSSVEVYSVTSRINKSYQAHFNQDTCADHARIDAHLTLHTADGRLDETVAKVSFIAHDGQEARAEFTIAARDLKGTYLPNALGRRCFVNTTFRILAALDGTHGSMVDDLLTADCSQPDSGGAFTLAGGHWGVRWQH